MLDLLKVSLDVGGIVASAIAAWLWYRAGAVTVRRVEADEEFNLRDFNRMAVAFNRASVRNRRGAIASAIAAFIVALNLLVQAAG